MFKRLVIEMFLNSLRNISGVLEKKIKFEKC